MFQSVWKILLSITGLRSPGKYITKLFIIPLLLSFNRQLKESQSYNNCRLQTGPSDNLYYTCDYVYSATPGRSIQGAHLRWTTNEALPFRLYAPCTLSSCAYVAKCLTNITDTLNRNNTYDYPLVFHFIIELCL